LESSTRIFEPEGQRLVAVRAEWSNEQGCELVRYAHRYLVVPRVRIEKNRGFRTLSLNQLPDLCEAKEADPWDMPC
jgi:hypothetical protein